VKQEEGLQKEYTNGRITVVWKPELCIHSGICAKNLPRVFRPSHRPWVKIHQASDEAIIQTVMKCPSKALTIEMEKHSYDTLSEAINGLRTEGYTEDFNLEANCLGCKNAEYKVFHDEFLIDKFFRFEGNSDPADESILYAISSDKYGLKGILVNGYGISSEPLTDEMAQKLRMAAP
jgi:uncharacterized Fe-S cluster protein YjdI